MGVFARFMRRSSRKPAKPTAGAAASEAGTGQQAKEEEGKAAAAGDGSADGADDVGIPKQQSADEAADSEAADDARK
jgi:hypothetical protein